MSRLSDSVPRDRFLPLPNGRNDSGKARRVGVEIEFAGLTERDVGALVQRQLGGEVADAGPFEVIVSGTALGEIRCFLDTAFRKGRGKGLGHLGLEFGREVIPVELTTEPLPATRLPELDALREALRDAGAIGSRRGPLLSFGMHLNVEVASERVESVRPVLTAFALIEDWLRLADPMNASRRLMPFTDAYPRRFVRELLALPPGAEMDALVALYLRLTPSRNRALDMLPLFRHLRPAQVASAAHNLAAVAPRPAWHYRLPDSRVDEADWTIAYEWNRWVMVERVAARPDLLAHLADEWARHDTPAARHAWCEQVDAILTEALPEPGR
ncbi:amidoligase family protein [Roseitranquillus sediminis]|uniref:amidoligase family protein n=1 Tax=Roseitranquillus sediminis TaxID=2809051 RepID=UPI001D0CC422|nr:amidoligase family protein [Roseitranquillus sediminis]MBM9593495.1 amidoligase family protein [Roseitranquillus sediminis]